MNVERDNQERISEDRTRRTAVRSDLCLYRTQLHTVLHIELLTLVGVYSKSQGFTSHCERAVRAHGGLGDRRWAWLVSTCTRCIGLGPSCVKWWLGLRCQPARALQWTLGPTVRKFSVKLFFTVFLGSSVQSHGHAANDTGIARSHKEDSHRPGGSPYPLDVITWCALPLSPLAGLKRQPEHFLSNDSGEALRLAESSHG